MQFNDETPAGQLFITPEAEQSGIDIVPLLRRHLSGDWGEVEDDVAEKNAIDFSEQEGCMSSYRFGEKYIWIVTDPGHETTTIMISNTKGDIMNNLVD